MQISRLFTQVLVLGCLLATSARSDDPKPAQDTLLRDPGPKASIWPYQAPGYTETDYDWWERKWVFGVACEGNENDVITKLNAPSEYVLRFIHAEIPQPVYEETKRRYDQPVVNVKPVDRVQWRTVQPVYTFDSGERRLVTPARAYWYDVCTRREVASTEEAREINSQGQVFSGTRTVGARVPNARVAWLEGLETRINADVKKGREGAPGGLVLGTVAYRVIPSRGSTEASKLAMFNETRRIAQTLATGPGSRFEKEISLLKFDRTKIYPREAVVISEPIFQPEAGSSADKSLPVNHTLLTKFTFSIYAETRSVRAPETPGETRPVEVPHQVVGTASAVSSYSVTSFKLNTTCHRTKEKAGEVIDPAAKQLALELEQFDLKIPVTDYLEDSGESDPIKDFEPYKPALWENGKVTLFLDTCTYQTIKATTSGTAEDLPAYWKATHSFKIHSSKYPELLKLVTDSRKKYFTKRPAPDAVIYDIDDVTGELTNEAKARLADQVRERAVECVRGPVAEEDKKPNTLCLHLKNFRIGDLDHPTVSVEASFAPAGMARGLHLGAMAPVPPTAPDLTIIEVVKPGQRPRASMLRWWEFRVEVTTENYKTNKLAPEASTPKS
jgi:hypothetical protein